MIWNVACSFHAKVFNINDDNHASAAGNSIEVPPDNFQSTDTVSNST
jgi:hypothetical protein